jgi:hypothetical protein
MRLRGQTVGAYPQALHDAAIVPGVTQHTLRPPLACFLHEQYQRAIHAARETIRALVGDRERSLAARGVPRAGAALALPRAMYDTYTYIMSEDR